MKIVDLYIRVSTDEQADKGYSQRHQEEMLQKYCSLNNLQVRKVIFEDHSAKTFNRPAWVRYLADLKKHKHQSDAVLFIKWDRFSRNAGDAYQMINMLRTLGVEPQSVEQPLDLSVPENKMMLAFYLAVPEVENDRRALNVFHGMRRAKKEGRFMGIAPLGYVNKIQENGRKYITPYEPEATLMKWVFETIATGRFPVEQVLTEARKKGLVCSKNNFWVCIRNAAYCGKIFIPAYKDEEATYVTGKHEPLISEALFYEVQDVLNGKKKKQQTKIHVQDLFPLRGFLACHICGKTLTASSSKGRTSYYHYYHCTSACGCRYKADTANDLFIAELKKYTPHPATLVLFKKVVSDVYKSNTSHSLEDKKRLLVSIEEQNKRVSKARELLLSEAIDAVDYKVIKSECEKELTRLEAKLSAIPTQKEDIEGLLDKACQTLGQLDKVYMHSKTAKKRLLIGSIFPEKLILENNAYRTTSVNEAVQLIYNVDKGFSQKKMGQTNDFVNLSHQVIPLGLEPRAHTLKVYCSTN
jgi:site-specific DNA recombinase